MDSRRRTGLPSCSRRPTGSQSGTDARGSGSGYSASCASKATKRRSADSSARASCWIEQQPWRRQRRRKRPSIRPAACSPRSRVPRRGAARKDQTLRSRSTARTPSSRPAGDSRLRSRSAVYRQKSTSCRDWQHGRRPCLPSSNQARRNACRGRATDSNWRSSPARVGAASGAGAVVAAVVAGATGAETRPEATPETTSPSWLGHPVRRRGPRRRDPGKRSGRRRLSRARRRLRSGRAVRRHRRLLTG